MEFPLQIIDINAVQMKLQPLHLQVCNIQLNGRALYLLLQRPQQRGQGAHRLSELLHQGDQRLALAQAHRLPILTVVLDNRGWSAVKEATRRVYPDGIAAQTDSFCARLDAAPERRFEDVARAFGAHGERVVTADQVEGAIARCLAALESGRSAVLTARVTPL